MTGFPCSPFWVHCMHNRGQETAVSYVLTMRQGGGARRLSGTAVGDACTAAGDACTAGGDACTAGGDTLIAGGAAFTEGGDACAAVCNVFCTVYSISLVIS